MLLDCFKNWGCYDGFELTTVSLFCHLRNLCSRQKIKQISCFVARGPQICVGKGGKIPSKALNVNIPHAQTMQLLLWQYIKEDILKYLENMQAGTCLWKKTLNILQGHVHAQPHGDVEESHYQHWWTAPHSPWNAKFFIGMAATKCKVGKGVQLVAPMQ